MDEETCRANDRPEKNVINEKYGKKESRHKDKERELSRK